MNNFWKDVLFLEGFYKGQKGTIVDALSEIYYQISIGNESGVVLFKKEELGKIFKIIEK